MKAKKLSIIIPCYNAEAYLPGLLRFLGSETPDTDEILLIDDGSTDSTASIIDEAATRYSFVRAIHQQNGGVSAARNHGIEAATGDYLYFLDSDDRLTRGSIRHIHQVMEQQPDADILAFGYRSETAGGKVHLYVWNSLDHQRMTGREANRHFLRKEFGMHLCASVFRQDFLLKKGLVFTEGLAIGEDVEFLMKCLASARWLYYDARMTFLYRIHEDSAMGGYRHYTKRHFRSMLVLLRVGENLSKTTGLRLSYSFFAANNYLSNLIYYLRVEEKDPMISRGFIHYQYLLRRPMKSSNRKRYAELRIASLIPIGPVVRLIKHD